MEYLKYQNNSYNCHWRNYSTDYNNNVHKQKINAKQKLKYQYEYYFYFF